MRHILTLTVLTTAFVATSYVSQSQAGFEWLPPAKRMATPAQPTAPMSAMNAPQDLMGQGGMAAVPAPSVTMEKLQTKTTPMGMTKQTGLVIDPYPLRAKKMVSLTAPGSLVEQALVEKSGGLHPLPLGLGMNTGVNIPNSPMALNGDYQAPMSGMTPMMRQNPMMMKDTNEVYTNAVGFGKDIPLALALSQIVPSNYSPSYVKDVDTGVTVTWEGGRPWNQVLQKTLNDQGLESSIRGNKVIIHPTGKI